MGLWMKAERAAEYVAIFVFQDNDWKDQLGLVVL